MPTDNDSIKDKCLYRLTNNQNGQALLAYTAYPNPGWDSGDEQG